MSWRTDVGGEVSVRIVVIILLLSVTKVLLVLCLSIKVPRFISDLFLLSLLLKICPFKSKALLVGLNSQLQPSLYK